jgi:hypothetical protein
MYQPVRISPDTPARVRRVIEHLDMLLGDVHAMLRLPLKEEGLTHGCNFAAATVLVEIIGGISSTLFKHRGGSGKRYRALVERYYPWDLEGRADLSQAAHQLYRFFRNPLAHELGMGGKKGGIGKSGFPEDLLERLELSPGPPSSGAIQSIPSEDMMHLSVDDLYWGTRVMIQRLTEDVSMMKKAEAYLEKQFTRKRRLRCYPALMDEDSIEYIKREFAETLGYIRGDLRWLLEKNSGLNYTIGLLIGCGCEMLAACREDGKRLGEKLFAELLPPGEWQQLADRLYSALRDGLAHGFDTKHLRVDDREHQIYLDSRGRQGLYIVNNNRGIGLHIGVRELAERLCLKIDEMERLVFDDEAVRERFMKSRQRTADLNTKEADAWRALVKSAGY